MKQLRTLKQWATDYQSIKQGIEDLEVLMFQVEKLYLLKRSRLEMERG